MTDRSILEQLMTMSDDVWDQHTNPWSGWSRLSIPPLFVLAVWSRVWLGWWCLLPIIFVVFWTWWNPRAFRKTGNPDNWMSKGVLGERIWLARAKLPIPARHQRMPLVLAACSAAGIGPLCWGLWQLQIWPTLLGLLLLMGGKLWFLDRMVWLYEDTRAQANRATAR